MVGDERDVKGVTVAIEENEDEQMLSFFIFLPWRGMGACWDLRTLVNTAGPAFAQMSSLVCCSGEFIFIFYFLPIHQF